MRRMAAKILKDDELAADAVQETLARLWHRRWRLGLMKNPQGFSMNALRNECIDTLRRQRVRNPLATDPDEVTDYQPSESEAAALEARYQRLEQAIATLPKQHQRLIKMKYVEQRSSREIAQLTGMTEGNVNTTMCRIYEELRKQMDENSEI
jgi:RNA polymerase sigma-70 factor (ECF subfamily)